jgi:tetratricopeptide (TPR) repeat protein
MIVILLLSVSALPCSRAQTPEDLWRSGSELYDQGDFNGALTNYRRVEAIVVSSELYFNLGNCYYQLDSVAKSILYFEKTIKLNPRGRTARENLVLARNRMDDPISSIDEFFLKRWLNKMSEVLPPMGWGLLCLVFIWLVVWMLVRSVRRGTLRRDRVRYTLPILVFLVCLFLGYVAFENQTDSDYAIVMESIAIRAAPDELSAITRTITGGEKVMILDKLDDYYKVRFVNYEHGWLPKSVVRRI